MIDINNINNLKKEIERKDLILEMFFNSWNITIKNEKSNKSLKFIDYLKEEILLKENILNNLNNIIKNLYISSESESIKKINDSLQNDKEKFLILYKQTIDLLIKDQLHDKIEIEKIINKYLKQNDKFKVSINYDWWKVIINQLKTLKNYKQNINDIDFEYKIKIFLNNN